MKKSIWNQLPNQVQLDLLAVAKAKANTSTARDIAKQDYDALYLSIINARKYLEQMHRIIAGTSSYYFLEGVKTND